MLRCTAFAWALGAAGAGAAQALPEQFRLTPQLLDRMEAIQAAAPPTAQIDDSEEPDAQSVEDLARKLDADPRSRALLARYKVNSLEYAQAAYAALHAGMFLAMESAADKKAHAAALASFTPAQRANIELMRRRMK